MVEVIGQYGNYLKPQSYYELRVSMLNMELEYTHKMLTSNKKQQIKYGCSIMTDGWTDTKGITLIIFLINSPMGTMFVKSIDVSAYIKTETKLFELLEKIVETVGESNVV